MGKHKHSRHYLDLDDQEEDESFWKSKYFKYGIWLLVGAIVLFFVFEFLLPGEKKQREEIKKASVRKEGLEKIKREEPKCVEEKMEKALSVVVRNFGIKDKYTYVKTLEQTTDLGTKLKEVEIQLPRNYSLTLFNYRLSQTLRRINAEIIDAKQTKWEGGLEMEIGLNGLKTHHLTIQKSNEIEPTNSKFYLVINDFRGADPEIFEKFIEMDIPLSFAILPNTDYKDTLVKLISKKENKSFLLHLPMEPKNYPQKDPGENAIFANLPPAAIKDRTVNFYHQLPQAIGISNYMGSKITSNKNKIRPVLEKTKELGLFFLDSKTSLQSVCLKVGNRIGSKVYRHFGFIDNPPTNRHLIEGEICNKALQVRTIKEPHIFMGHCKQSTYEALKSSLNKLSEWRISFANLDEVVK